MSTVNILQPKPNLDTVKANAARICVLVQKEQAKAIAAVVDTFRKANPNLAVEQNKPEKVEGGRLLTIEVKSARASAVLFGKAKELLESLESDCEAANGQILLVVGTRVIEAKENPDSGNKAKVVVAVTAGNVGAVETALTNLRKNKTVKVAEKHEDEKVTAVQVVQALGHHVTADTPLTDIAAAVRSALTRITKGGADGQIYTVTATSSDGSAVPVMQDFAYNLLPCAAVLMVAQPEAAQDAEDVQEEAEETSAKKGKKDKKDKKAKVKEPEAEDDLEEGGFDEDEEDTPVVSKGKKGKKAVQEVAAPAKVKSKKAKQEEPEAEDEDEAEEEVAAPQKAGKDKKDKKDKKAKVVPAVVEDDGDEDEPVVETKKGKKDKKAKKVEADDLPIQENDADDEDEDDIPVVAPKGKGKGKDKGQGKVKPSPADDTFDDEADDLPIIPVESAPVGKKKDKKDKKKTK